MEKQSDFNYNTIYEIPSTELQLLEEPITVEISDYKQTEINFFVIACA